ncbi:MAG: hypothetical protein ABI653_03860 [Bacteroidota bacterium]
MDQNNNSPIKDEKDVPKSNDAKIDQDFPGFPGLPAKKEVIKPENKKDEKDAGMELNNSNEKSTDNLVSEKKNIDFDEIQSDGSAGAFDATENVQEDAGNNNYIRKNK